MVRITPEDAKGMMDAYAKVYAPKEEPALETPDGVNLENTPPETENPPEN